jgi:hypothetical protein
MEESQNNTKKVTYMCLSGSDGVNLEVDLVTFREKGQQTKYLSISFVDTTQEPPVTLSSQALDQNAFIEIKEFFKQLDWNQ